MNDSQRLQYVGEQDVIPDGTRGRCVCDRGTVGIRSCERETRGTVRESPVAGAATRLSVGSVRAAGFWA